MDSCHSLRNSGFLCSFVSSVLLFLPFFCFVSSFVFYPLFFEKLETSSQVFTCFRYIFFSSYLDAQYTSSKMSGMEEVGKNRRKK